MEKGVREGGENKCKMVEIFPCFLQNGGMIIVIIVDMTWLQE